MFADPKLGELACLSIDGKPPVKIYVSLYKESNIFVPVGFSARNARDQKQ